MERRGEGLEKVAEEEEGGGGGHDWKIIEPAGGWVGWLIVFNDPPSGQIFRDYFTCCRNETETVDSVCCSAPPPPLPAPGHIKLTPGQLALALTPQ